MSGREEIIGDCRLILGDCREEIPRLGRFDACVTDPPYGIGEDGGRFRGRKGQNIRVLPKGNWDSETPAAEVFALMLACSDEQIIWGGNYFADKLPVSKGWLYWQKLMGGDFSDGELAWTSRNRALREFTKCPKNQGAEHPTQKPVELMEWCLPALASPPSVIDPFMGSGNHRSCVCPSGAQIYRHRTRAPILRHSVSENRGSLPPAEAICRAKGQAHPRCATLVAPSFCA